MVCAPEVTGHGVGASDRSALMLLREKGTHSERSYGISLAFVSFVDAFLERSSLVKTRAATTACVRSK
jgi:hypothetical protein